MGVVVVMVCWWWFLLETCPSDLSFAENYPPNIRPIILYNSHPLYSGFKTHFSSFVLRTLTPFTVQCRTFCYLATLGRGILYIFRFIQYTIPVGYYIILWHIGLYYCRGYFGCTHILDSAQSEKCIGFFFMSAPK